MCISLSPLNVTSPFITANLLPDNKVVVSYSIITSEPIVNVLRGRQEEKEVIYAWFLPIKDYAFDEITVLNLSKKDKCNINDALDYIEAQKRQNVSRSASRSISMTKGLSDVVTLQDGSQVVRAANPIAIFDQINNVNPEFKEKLSATADVAIYATNSVDALKNSACLVYLFKGSNLPSRDYLAYEVPYNGEGDFYLPTVENDHKSLTIPKAVNRDNTFMWGGYESSHKGAIDLELNTSDNSIIPDNIYGMFDFNTVYPGQKFANGWIGINFQDTDPDNIPYNKDSEAVSSFDIL
jgi:hypothetical protein